MIKLLIILLTLLVSCSSSPTEFRVGLSQEPNTLDLHNTTSQTARYIAAENILERIIVQDNNGVLHPALLDSYSLSEDKKTITFDILDDLYFSNGDKVKQSDYLFSLNRWLASSFGAKQIVGQDTYFSAHNGAISLTSENSLILLPYYMASSKQAAVLIQESEELIIKNPIGTGPYYLDSWTIGSNIKLKKVENYKKRGDDFLDLNGEKKAYHEAISYYFIRDDFSRTSALEKEEIYFMNDLPFDYLDKEFKNGMVYKDNETGSLVLLLNKAEGLLENKTIRQALEVGLDKNRLMLSCYTQESFVLNQNYMQSTLKNYQVDLPSAENDKPKAISMIKNTGLYGKEITVLTSNNSNMDKTGLVLKDELEKLGFTVNLEIRDWATYLELRQDKSSFDIAITALTNDSIPSQKLFFSPSYPGWTNDEELTLLLDKFNNAESTEKADEAWKEIQLYSYDYIPAIVLGHYKTAYLVNPKLKDVIYNNGFYFYSSYLDN